MSWVYRSGLSYCADNGHFKVFESHARDIYGQSHPRGTCDLLDISSTDNLVQQCKRSSGIKEIIRSMLLDYFTL